MAVQPSVTCLDVYHKLVALETQLQDFRQLVWALKPTEVKIECRHPVKLEGIWVGAEITEDDIAAAKRSVFAIENAITKPV
ncbi:MAG: hypothetical protein DPW09_38610 [Anaerolineae bacterium]|nr:hypothetical protein [Anaerolineae bacterium]